MHLGKIPCLNDVDDIDKFKNLRFHEMNDDTPYLEKLNDADLCAIAYYLKTHIKVLNMTSKTEIKRISGTLCEHDKDKGEVLCLQKKLISFDRMTCNTNDNHNILQFIAVEKGLAMIRHRSTCNVISQDLSHRIIRIPQITLHYPLEKLFSKEYDENV